MTLHPRSSSGHARPLRIKLVKDSAFPERPCPLKRRLEDLGDPSCFPRFARLFGAPSLDGLGDCHEVAIALMLDLADLHRADGWVWAMGTCTSQKEADFTHSWLQCDGWMLDASNGHALVAPMGDYRGWMHARNVVTRTAQQVLEWLKRAQINTTDPDAFCAQLLRSHRRTSIK